MHAVANYGTLPHLTKLFAFKLFATATATAATIATRIAAVLYNGREREIFFQTTAEATCRRVRPSLH